LTINHHFEVGNICPDGSANEPEPLMATIHARVAQKMPGINGAMPQGRQTGTQLDMGERYGVAARYEGNAVLHPARLLQNQTGPSARLRLSDA
jgi:hypothetical protein